MSPQVDPFLSFPIMESFEMANQVGNFTEPVISPTMAEQGSDPLGGSLASPVAETRTWPRAPQVPENPMDHHSKQLEESLVSETDPEAMLKLPRYISEALYVVDLHPLAVENVNYLLGLFGRVGTVCVIKVIPKPPGTPGIPLCSAYINFHTVEDACRAWQTLNYHVWMGQPMRIMFSNLDPATRYNDNANIIVLDLEESIDSKFLHQRFCKYGAVVSSKVAVDSNGKSTGRAFIQFEDEIDAKRAIEVMNNEKLRGRKVYVGPFIRRQVHSEAEPEMNKNSMNLKTAIPSQDLKDESLPIGKHGSREILLGSSSTSGKRSRDFGTSHSPAHGSHDLLHEHGFLKIHSSGSGKTTWNATMPAEMEETNVQTQGRHGVREVKERERNLRRGTKASRNLARRRYRLNQILAEKMSSSENTSQIPEDLPTVLSSEPWPPQPWSFETLKDKLTKSHIPEERLAMLGATLFPLVARHTKTLVSDVTNVLVNLDLAEIERTMHLSEEDLHRKVEEVKQHISERVPVAFAPPTFVDVHEAAPRSVEEKHVIFVEEFKDLPPPVPAPAPLLTPAPIEPAPNVNFNEFFVPSFPQTRTPTDPVPSVSFNEFLVPSFPVPVVPEFLQAPALPGFSLGVPVSVPFPLLPLPFVTQPLVQPWFPDSVLNYTGYRPQPGTGFYEPLPRVRHLEDMYYWAAALARAYVVHEDKPLAVEESADPVQELEHTERIQAVREPAQLMIEAFACGGLASIVEESAEQMEECVQEERAQAVEESVKQEEFVQAGQAGSGEENSAELMEEVAQEERAEAESAELMEEVADTERAQAEEGSAEMNEEVANVEQANQAREESAELMEEVVNDEQARGEEESPEMNEEVANIQQANQAPEESTAVMEEVANNEQARAEEKFAEMNEEVAHVEQARAREEPADLVVEFRD